MSELTSLAQARMSELDRTLDMLPVSSELAQELFAVVDVLDAQPAVRRALTDPGKDATHKGALVAALFADRISKAAVAVVQAAVGLRWEGGRTLAAALDRQGVRAELLSALNAGELDRVEEELFRIGRAVDGDRQLRQALTPQSATKEARRSLVSDLLSAKAAPSTLVLARRAVDLRGRTYELTLDGYLALAADVRSRAVAKVTVAQAMTAEQRDKLRRLLSKQAGRDVAIQEIIDSSVLGGVRVQLGDDVIEGTVAAKLDAARRSIG